MARGLATTSTQARADAVFLRGGVHNPTARPILIQCVASAAAGVRITRLRHGELHARLSLIWNLSDGQKEPIMHIQIFGSWRLAKIIS